jgi:hypothetical protein
MTNIQKTCKTDDETRERKNEMAWKYVKILNIEFGGPEMSERKSGKQGDVVSAGRRNRRRKLIF